MAHGLQTKPGAAAFVADRETPAAALVGVAGFVARGGHAAGACGHHDARAAAVCAQQLGDTVVAQHAQRETGVGLQEGGALRRHAGTGQAQAQRDISRRRRWQVCVAESRCQGLQHMPPGLFDALAQARRPGMALTQGVALMALQAHAGAGAAAIHARQIKRRHSERARRAPWC